MELHHRHSGDDSSVDHRDNEQIVELARVSTRFEAEILVAALDARGIKATAEHGEVGGWIPQLSPRGRHRVLVFERDLDTAREVVAEQEPAEGSGDVDA